MDKTAKTITWKGYGVLSARGGFLEAFDTRSHHVLEKFEGAPAGSYLVRLKAQMECLTPSEFVAARDRSLGIVEATYCSIKERRLADRLERLRKKIEADDRELSLSRGFRRRCGNSPKLDKKIMGLRQRLSSGRHLQRKLRAKIKSRGGGMD